MAMAMALAIVLVLVEVTQHAMTSIETKLWQMVHGEMNQNSYLNTWQPEYFRYKI
jgi:hypothetical protein